MLYVGVADIIEKEFDSRESAGKYRRLMTVPLKADDSSSYDRDFDFFVSIDFRRDCLIIQYYLT